MYSILSLCMRLKSAPNYVDRSENEKARIRSIDTLASITVSHHIVTVYTVFHYQEIIADNSYISPRRSSGQNAEFGGDYA